MRAFIILCLCSLAAARPGNLNYEAHSSDFASSLPSGYDYSAGGAGIGGDFGLGGAGLDGLQGLEGFGGGYGGGGAVPLVTKRFFIHSAPADEEDEHELRTLNIGTPRRNYNVLFVKAPAAGAKKTTLKITPAVNEDKTVVYVLSQKSKSPEVDAQVYHAAAPTPKPEVFFIKYNTEEEAAHAQQNIQAQYDHLGGATQISNEGVAPVQSVIGALGGGHGGSAGSSHGAGHSSAQGSGHAAVNNKYLPPGKK